MASITHTPTSPEPKVSSLTPDRDWRCADLAGMDFTELAERWQCLDELGLAAGDHTDVQDWLVTRMDETFHEMAKRTITCRNEAVALMRALANWENADPQAAPATLAVLAYLESQAA